MTDHRSSIDVPSFEDIRAAAERIEPFVHHTPVMTSSTIDQLVGARVHLKCEHLQRAGAFKFRGATNAVMSLDPDVAVAGVVAHSSGNHAAALALAAATRGIPCRVVMPTTAPRAKQAAVRAYGGEIVWCEPTPQARDGAVAEVLAEHGGTEIHPYDDVRVIAGQGTATLELLRAVPSIGLVVAPVSGGGLLSGTAIAAHGLNPAITVVGAEPEQVDDAGRSLAAGHLISTGNGTSIADGLLATLSDRTFSILSSHGVRIVTVSEQQIIDAMALLFGRAKQVVEPSGAAALAGLIELSRTTELPDDIGVVLSGGNLDLDELPFGGAAHIEPEPEAS